MEAHGRGTPTSSAASLVVPTVRRSFAHKNAAAGEARRVFKQKVYPATTTGRLRQAGCRSQHRGCGVPGIERGSSRKPPSRRLRSCVAASLHTKGHMWCRCASRLTDTAYSPDYQIFGRERRQCKVVRRDALHAPTPRSALPRLQPGRFPEDVRLFIILRRRGGRGYRRGAVCRGGFRSGWLCGRCCRRDCSLSRLWLCIRRYRWARTIQESGVCR